MQQDYEKLKQAKEQCIADISVALHNYANRLNSIDERLMIYIEDALSNNASHANLYELLGIRKTLRLMDSYDLDIPRARRKITAIEGQWKNGKHVKGGLKFSTPRGQQHVRLMPFQVYAECSIHMFVTDVCMERPYYEGDALLPSEWVGEDGMVWDTRRLIQEAHWFFTRKSGKTELGAAEDFTEVCFLGDINGQALICTNSAEQSQIAYKAIREFAMQVDPTCVNRMGGKFFRMTRNGMNWQPGHRMKGEIKCLSAGKTSKDGLYASVVHADEHGQARYVNGVSDMQSTVETAWGSTGPRREKLLLHTTTAGTISDGPYKRKLEQVEQILLTELDYPLGTARRTADDYWTAMLLQLDKWEITDHLDELNSTELFKKCNRSIGTTVQPDYYRKRLHEAATGTEDTKREVLTKDFNMWQSDRFVKWLTGDHIRQRQVECRIWQCPAAEGWRVFCGLDFGGRNDMWAAAYLAVNYAATEPEGRFFADLDLWITEEALKESPNRPIYEMWVREGWLNVCPGEVFSHEMAINQIMYRAGYNPRGELIVSPNEQIDISMFGFDPAQSTTPINTLKAWLQSLGIDAQTIKRMVVPVPQTFVATNGTIQEVEEMTLASRPALQFSMNPAWPWMFQNCKLEKSPNELVKVLKSAEHNKVDGVHALLDAFYAFDLSEGNIQQ